MLKHMRAPDENDQNEGMRLRMLIAHNIKVVARSHKTLPEDQLSKRLQASGLSRNTAYRVTDPQKYGTTWGIDVLPVVARAMGVQPWELLLPDLEVTGANGIVSMKSARARQWPFPTLLREDFDGLSPEESLRLETTIKNRIAELKSDRPFVAPKKADGTNR